MKKTQQRILFSQDYNMSVSLLKRKVIFILQIDFDFDHSKGKVHFCFNIDEKLSKLSRHLLNL